MILYVNGDSNSAGEELKNSKDSWPELLADRLNATLINKSTSGSSNSRILRTVKQDITDINNRDILVIIGWTSWEREEWEYQGQYYQVNASGADYVPQELQARYKLWVTDQDSKQQALKSQIQHEQIYDLHQDLTAHQIPHLFFNALMPFQHNLTNPIHQAWSKDYYPVYNDWKNNYLGPYENNLSYYWHLKQSGFTPTNNNHYKEDGQKYWSNFLFNQIQERQLI